MKKQKWSILEFYEKSWALALKHKKLWILGFAAMLYAAGGSSGRINLPSGSGSSDYEKEEVKEEIQDFDFNPGEENVLGLNTSEEYAAPEQELFLETEDAETEKQVEEFLDFLASSEFKNIGNIFKSIPAYIYALLGLEIFALIIFSLILGLVASSWAEAALMKGVSQAHEEDKLNLTKVSKFATTKIKSLLWVKYIPVIRFFVLTLLALLGSAIVIAILSKSLGDMLAIVATLAFIVGAIAFVFLLYRLTIRVLYAKWHCVIDNLSGSKSFAAGVNTAHKNLRKTLWLMFCNMLVSMLSILFFAVPAIIFILIGVLIVFIGGAITAFSVWSMIFVSPIVLALILAMVIVFSFIGAILQVFFSSVWYLAFKAVKK